MLIATHDISIRERERTPENNQWRHISEMAFSSRSGSSMGSLVILRLKRRSICCIVLTPSTKLMASPVLPIQVILVEGEGECG